MGAGGVVSAAGTFTFLFTDIEGSTRLWEDYPEAMRVALARHDALLRQTIGEAGGEVFKTVGDAFCAAFASAPDALKAAVMAQRTLMSETWEGLGRPLRVRMALHTGTAERRSEDYFGQSLNRIARLMKAAHGGQVLLSEAACELLRSNPLPGVELRDLGEHLLKDLARPEHVYQLVLPDLLCDFPPLRSLEAFTHNLPIQLTSFIGRDRELAVVKQRLEAERLLTLIGAGGSGKTRLMLQVGADVIDQFEHGVWLAELAPLADPELVVQTVANALGVREEPGKPLLNVLIDHLRSRRVLLVLDNCEHVVTACAAFVSKVLAGCPTVRVLASSREPLGVQGEGIYTVPPLSTPRPMNGRAPSPEELLGSPAVRLFVDRAAHSQPAFELNETNATAVAQICHRLDGIPLALELAAARIRILSAEQIATRLSDRFRLLTGGDRSALPRQQTLRALIDWSYDLLGEQERRLFARLSVFAGGWTVEAAEQVASDEFIEEWEVLDLMCHLVDKSLVVPEEEGRESGETRYRLLQTMRHYAQERLREFGEEEALQARHRDVFVSLAERAEAGLLGAEQGQWLDRLEAEYDNLRAALECAAATDPEAGLRAVGVLWRFWSVRAYFTEGRAWLGRFLEATGGTGEGAEASAERARAFRAAGALASNQGDSRAAQQLLSEGLRIFEALGDQRGAAGALNSLGNVAWRHGEFTEARGLYERSLDLARETGDRRAVAVALISLGNVACQQGDYTASQAHYEEALSATRAIGNREWEAATLQNLGDVLWLQGQSERAGALYEQSLSLRRELGDRRGVAASLGNLGNVASHRGDYKEARRLHEEALAMNRASGDRQWEAIALANLGDLDRTEGHGRDACRRHREALAVRAELDDRWGIAQSLSCLAQSICASEDARRAARLFGAAEVQREAIGAALAPIEQPEYDRYVAQAREALGEEAFAALWAEGRALSVEQAVAEGLQTGE